MQVPSAVESWCRDEGFGGIRTLSRVAGGCIHQGSRLITTSGRTFFLKQNQSVPDDMFRREAEGLRALAATACIRVPEPFLVGTQFLVMEDLNPASPGPDYWSRFGRQLAALHDATSDRFGFDHPNYLGSTPQPNPWTEDGHEFFINHRLLFQAELAVERGLLREKSMDLVDQLCQKLPSLVPRQPASLLHGDLWSGNAMSDEEGEPALIDPAVHFGWAEAELGMTQLFGGFPERFYLAYEESRSLDAGWHERLPIYNLYHLLNHLNLFGRSYLAQVESILNRFV